MEEFHNIIALNSISLTSPDVRILNILGNKLRGYLIISAIFRVYCFPGNTFSGYLSQIITTIEKNFSIVQIFWAKYFLNPSRIFSVKLPT